MLSFIPVKREYDVNLPEFTQLIFSDEKTKIKTKWLSSNFNMFYDMYCDKDREEITMTIPYTLDEFNSLVKYVDADKIVVSDYVEYRKVLGFMNWFDYNNYLGHVYNLVFFKETDNKTNSQFFDILSDIANVSGKLLDLILRNISGKDNQCLLNKCTISSYL